MKRSKKDKQHLPDPQTEEYIKKLTVTDPLRESLLHRVITDLEISPGSRGLDAGCGIGSQCLLLAEAVQKNGQVTGLDINPAFLDYARLRVRSTGLSGRINFKEGDIHALPFERESFDWLWSADCAGYREPNPLPLVQELIRVVKPGGFIALLYYSSQMFFPGYPFLEAKLNAVFPRSTPFNSEMLPESHCLRTAGWFRSAGLVNIRSETFSRTLQSPLEDNIRLGMLAMFEMLWEKNKNKLSGEDRKLYEHLTRPDSPGFILNLPDYYGFFTYSLFQAERPASPE
ncbi:MAG: class I SAM-dependent methyltransferase [Candidatus Aminicenantes bacterium]|nr:class I SAM-dependent methyltransferase [Candidatus Aminicenantes bacterium]